MTTDDSVNDEATSESTERSNAAVLNRRRLMQLIGSGGVAAGLLDSDGVLPDAGPVGTSSAAIDASSCTYDGPPTYSGNGWPQYGEWTQTAMGAGGMVNGMTQADANSCVFYLWSDVGGTFRSDDHGDLWYLVDAGTGVRGLSVDPRDEDTVVEARGDGIYRSTSAYDRGSWTKVHDVSFAPNGDYRKTGNAITRKPDDDDVLLAAGQDDKIYRSTDNGQTWTALEDAPAVYYTDVRYDPSDTTTIYACSQSVDGSLAGLWKSSDGGDTWTIQVTNTAPTLIEFDPSTSAIYGIWDSDEGTLVQRSTDGGDTWSDFTSGLSTQSDLFTFLTTSDYVYVFSIDVVGSYGTPEIYRLPVGGSSWELYEDVSTSEIDDTGWFWEDGGETMNGGIADVADAVINDTDSSTWHVAATSMGHAKSSDAGATWTYSAKGHSMMEPLELKTDPRNDKLYAGVADTKFFRLKNDGADWDIHREEMAHASIARLDYAATNPDRIVATSAFYFTWPLLGRILISTDGGDTWRQSDQTGLEDVVDDPDGWWTDKGEQLQCPVGVSIDPTDANHVVVAIGGAGAYRSTDGGDTWSEIGSLGSEYDGGYFDRLMWAGFEQIALSGDGSIVTAPSISGHNPLYWDPSTESWNEALDPGNANPWHVERDPNTDGRFLLCYLEDDLSGGGLWESTDGGQSWTKILDEGVGYATFDPNDSSRIAVAREEDSPMVSEDGGETWTATDSNLPDPWRNPLAFSGDNLVAGGGGTSYFWNDLSDLDTTAPTAPSNLSSPATGTDSVDLDWDASSDGGSGVDHYNVYVDGSKDHEVSAGTTSTTVDPLLSGTSFDFHVTAVDGAGNESAASNAITVTTDGDTTKKAFTVEGGGHNGISNGSWDKFHWVYEQVSGDVTRTARLVSASDPSDERWHAGVVMRGSTSNGSPKSAAIAVDGDGTAFFQERTTSGNSGSYTTGSTYSLPVYLRLERSGDTITGHVSTDGSTWEAVGSTTISMSSPYVGLASSSREGDSTGVLLSADFDEVNGLDTWSNADVGDSKPAGNVTDTSSGGDSTAPTAPSNLSSPAHTDASVDLDWDASSDDGGSGLDHYNVYVDGTKDQEVAAGTTSTTVSGLSGGTSYDLYVTAVDGAGNESSASNTITVTTDSATNAFTVEGGGWGGIDSDDWDQFHWAYEQVSGDTTLVARLPSASDPDADGTWHAGVALRGDATYGAPKGVAIAIKGDGTVFFQERSSRDGSAIHTTGSTYSLPVYLKLERSGDTVTGYVSSDGSSWTQVGSASVSMTDPYRGLASSSQNGSVLLSADFDEVDGLDTWSNADVGNADPAGSVTEN